MFVFRAVPEKNKLLAALYILCNPVIERLGQGCQIPVSHVAVKGALLGEPGFFQCGQDVTEGGQTGDLVLTERSQLEFGGVGDPLRQKRNHRLNNTPQNLRHIKQKRLTDGSSGCGAS